MNQQPDERMESSESLAAFPLNLRYGTSQKCGDVYASPIVTYVTLDEGGNTRITACVPLEYFLQLLEESLIFVGVFLFSTWCLCFATVGIEETLRRLLAADILQQTVVTLQSGLVTAVGGRWVWEVTCAEGSRGDRSVGEEEREEERERLAVAKTCLTLHSFPVNAEPAAGC